MPSDLEILWKLKEIARELRGKGLEDAATKVDRVKALVIESATKELEEAAFGDLERDDEN